MRAEICAFPITASSFVSYLIGGVTDLHPYFLAHKIVPIYEYLNKGFSVIAIEKRTETETLWWIRVDADRKLTHLEVLC